MLILSSKDIWYPSFFPLRAESIDPFTCLSNPILGLSVPFFSSGVERKVQQQRLKDHLCRRRPRHPHLRLSHVKDGGMYKGLLWKSWCQSFWVVSHWSIAVKWNVFCTFAFILCAGLCHSVVSIKSLNVEILKVSDPNVEPWKRRKAIEEHQRDPV